MDYIDKFKLVYERQKEKIPRKIAKYEKSGLPANPINFYSFLSGTLETIAIGDYILHDDINSYKNNLYNASQAYIKAVNFFDTNKVLESSGLMSMISYRELLRAVASDSSNSINNIANLMGGRDKIDITDIDEFTYHWGYALKCIALNEHDKALKHLDKIDDTEMQMYVDYLYSIIKKDHTMAMKNIQSVITHQKNNNAVKGTPYELLSVTVIALAKLGLKNDIDISVDDKIVPKELILIKNDTDYSLNKILLIN